MTASAAAGAGLPRRAAARRRRPRRPHPSPRRPGPPRARRPARRGPRARPAGDRASDAYVDARRTGCSPYLRRSSRSRRRRGPGPGPARSGSSTIDSPRRAGRAPASASSACTARSRSANVGERDAGRPARRRPGRRASSRRPRRRRPDRRRRAPRGGRRRRPAASSCGLERVVLVGVGDARPRRSRRAGSAGGRARGPGPARRRPAAASSSSIPLQLGRGRGRRTGLRGRRSGEAVERRRAGPRRASSDWWACWPWRSTRSRPSSASSAAGRQAAVDVGPRTAARPGTTRASTTSSAPGPTNRPSTAASAAPGRTIAGVGPSADEQLERLDHQGLARAGLAGDGGHAGDRGPAWRSAMMPRSATCSSTISTGRYAAPVRAPNLAFRIWWKSRGREGHEAGPGRGPRCRRRRRPRSSGPQLAAVERQRDGRAAR